MRATIQSDGLHRLASGDRLASAERNEAGGDLTGSPYSGVTSATFKQIPK